MARGWVCPRDVIAGSLRVVEVYGRNLNLAVSLRRGGLFLKQPDPAEQDAAESLRQELAFYQENGEGPLSPWLPRLRFAQADPALLVLELLPGVEPFGRSLPGLRARSAELGRALSTLHRRFDGALPPGLDARPPWPLSLARPGPELFERGGPAGLELARLLQGHAMEALDALRDSWRPHTALHGDLRAANVLCCGKSGLKLVDWEMIQAGEAAWDLGCALGIFVERWLGALPMRGSPAQALRDTPLPMRRLRPAVGALLAAYGADPTTLQRAIAFAGARVLQGIAERTRGAERLGPRALLSLQVAINLLRTDRGLAFFGEAP